MYKTNRKFIIYLLGTLSTLTGTVIVSVWTNILRISFLKMPIPLWVIIIPIILFIPIIPIIFTYVFHIRKKPKLIFYISSQFPDNEFQALLIQNIIRQLEYEKIQTVVMLPSKNLDPISQQKWFDTVLQYKNYFIGGFIVPIDSTYSGDYSIKIKKFVTNFSKPVLFIDAPPPFKKEELEFLENSGFVGYDNSEGGELAAKAMCQELSKLSDSNLNVLIIASKVVSERQKGFEKHLKEIMGEKLSKIVCRDEGQFRREDGFQIYKEILRLSNNDYSLYQGIFCTNDEMALGVLSFINDIGGFPKEKVVIIGYDAITEVIELIKSGETPLKNSVKQDPDYLASTSAEKLRKMIEGERIIKWEIITPTLCIQ